MQTQIWFIFVMQLQLDLDVIQDFGQQEIESAA